MIAVVGRFETVPLAEALTAMAANVNPGYDHELRSEGASFQHDCGWGIVFRKKGGLARHRSAASCLEDPEFARLAGVASDLVVLHARRTPDRSTIDVQNSHPFTEEWAGTTWAFCHNGAVSDLTQLRPEPSLSREGGVDSEVMFHHVLAEMDPAAPETSLASSLSSVSDFTCLNCFLATPEHVSFYARAADDSPRPRYYTLWLGRTDGLAVVSSEPFSAFGLVWEPVPAGRAFRLST